MPATTAKLDQKLHKLLGARVTDLRLLRQLQQQLSSLGSTPQATGREGLMRRRMVAIANQGNPDQPRDEQGRWVGVLQSYGWKRTGNEILYKGNRSVVIGTYTHPHFPKLSLMIQRTSGLGGKPGDWYVKGGRLGSTSGGEASTLIGALHEQHTQTENLSAAEVDDAAQATDTDPSDAQKEAGNYAKGKIRIQGLHIAIENPAGSVRSGTRADGSKWEQKMTNHYGYIKRTESAADGDHVDVFLGPNPDSDKVYVIDQMKDNGKFDEHKCMVGFDRDKAAVKAYYDNYPDDWRGLGSITIMKMDEFKDWLENGDTSQPVATSGLGRQT